MAHVQRTILLQYADEKRSITFRVERWFIAGDEKAESIVKPALIWSSDESDTEHVILFGTDEIRAVIGELMAFA